MNNANYCQYCAEPIDPSMVFCPSCGDRIVWNTPADQQAKMRTWPGYPPSPMDARLTIARTEQEKRDAAKAKARAELPRNLLLSFIALLVICVIVFG